MNKLLEKENNKLETKCGNLEEENARLTKVQFNVSHIILAFGTSISMRFHELKTTTNKLDDFLFLANPIPLTGCTQSRDEEYDTSERTGQIYRERTLAPNSGSYTQ